MTAVVRFCCFPFFEARRVIISDIRHHTFLIFGRPIGMYRSSIHLPCFNFRGEKTMSKIVLVTGGSRGIGAATCIRFAEAGHTVIRNYNRSREAALMLAHSQNQMGRAIYPCHADISDRASVEKMVDGVIAKFGRIDVLVNNAGIAKQQLFTDVTAEDWNITIRLNFIAICGIILLISIVFLKSIPNNNMNL